MIAFGKRACEGRERQGKPQELCCCDRGRIIFLMFLPYSLEAGGFRREGPEDNQKITAATTQAPAPPGMPPLQPRCLNRFLLSHRSVYPKKKNLLLLLVESSQVSCLYDTVTYLCNV
jgi:hypothetical protein